MQCTYWSIVLRLLHFITIYRCILKLCILSISLFSLHQLKSLFLFKKNAWALKFSCLSIWIGQRWFCFLFLSANFYFFGFSFALLPVFFFLVGLQIWRLTEPFQIKQNTEIFCSVNLDPFIGCRSTSNLCMNNSPELYT